MADTATTGGARHRGARWSWTFGPSQETVAPKERRYFFLRPERRRSRYRSTHAAVNCAFGPLFGHHCQPFGTMAVFHASCVFKTSSEERHTCERSRSDVIRRSSHPSGCVTRMQRATFSPLRSVHASPSSIGTVPIFSLSCGVHGGAILAGGPGTRPFVLLTQQTREARRRWSRDARIGVCCGVRKPPSRFVIFAARDLPFSENQIRIPAVHSVGELRGELF